VIEQMSNSSSTNSSWYLRKYHRLLQCLVCVHLSSIHLSSICYLCTYVCMYLSIGSVIHNSATLTKHHLHTGRNSTCTEQCPWARGRVVWTTRHRDFRSGNDSRLVDLSDNMGAAFDAGDSAAVDCIYRRMLRQMEAVVLAQASERDVTHEHRIKCESATLHKHRSPCESS